MNQTGKYIVYLLFGLLAAAALISSCSDGNEPGDITHPKDKISLSISFQSEQQVRAENGLRANEGGEIDPGVFDREKAVYSLAVLVFKNGTNELDRYECINRSLDDITGTRYKVLDEIKGISLTAGIRDVYIIANAPDGHFDGVTDFDSFKAMMEDLKNQGMFGLPVGGSPDPENPIGGEEPDDRFINLVMSRSFTGLLLNSGADVYYLGYTGNGGRPAGVSTGTPVLKDGNPIKVELVRLVARVAIQKISFNFSASPEFETGVPISVYNHYVDTVFLLNAKTLSSYFPEISGFHSPLGAFGYGNTPGYNYLKDIFSLPDGTYADYLSIPTYFPDYDIAGPYAPLWFYAFENDDSDTSPTAFVIGVKYQYVNQGESEVKTKKVYYPVVINRNGAGSAGHDFIKRNNQYGIKVTIKGLGSYMTGYPGLKSATFRAMNDLLDTEGVMEIEETVGTDLFPWTGNVYK